MGDRNAGPRAAQVWPGSSAEGAIQADEERELVLRALGANRRERERLRRGRHRPRTRSGARDKELATKRLAHYIDKQVDWTQAGVNRTEIIEAWAALSEHDVGKANDWWNKGVHPLDGPNVLKLLESGLRPADLFATVHGKTIVEHIRAGSSVTWCQLALDWRARSRAR